VAGRRVERRLAAVLAADVAGYSRLMGADEVGTLAALKAIRRAIVDPAIAEHKGRIVKTTGDGLLVEFASAVDAVTCAMGVQAKMAESALDGTSKITFRIGINIGDIIIEGDDIFGDGVNVAARVENECEPGGVCLSGSAFEQVRGKTEFTFDDLGEQALKNIDRPVRLYAVRQVGEKQIAASSSDTKKPPPLPDKPSIAVLPFQNMSGDPEQEYFADGMVEELITALSRFKSLFVIARNSSFTYKGKVVDIKQVGRELGVRYVLEGSVRRSGGRLRITGQLIDSGTGAHLWADHFDGSAEDVFDLQDRVTANVVAQLFSSVQIEEEERASRKPTDNLAAYDYYLRGMSALWKWTKEESETALTQLAKAIELDDKFALAHVMLGRVCTFRRQIRAEGVGEAAKAVYHARRSLELSRDDALVSVGAGFTLAYMAHEVKFGADCIARGLAMNPNLAWGWLFSGWVNAYRGEAEVALKHLANAERLSPRDPTLAQIKMASALAHFVAEHYEEAIRLTEMITSELPGMLGAWRFKAASYGMSGDIESAISAGHKLLELDPVARVSLYVSLLPLQRPGDRERYRQGLLAAGLPD
jgi:TolB-like protein/class 3 adenylate cyclase/tetratricopeptide (TPR) repeat protein